MKPENCKIYVVKQLLPFSYPLEEILEHCKIRNLKADTGLSLENIKIEIKGKLFWKIKQHLKDGTLCLPIYMYKHSGTAINTTGFHCKWDSGLIGCIIMTFEDIRKVFGCKRVTKKQVSNGFAFMRGTIDLMDYELQHPDLD